MKLSIKHFIIILMVLYAIASLIIAWDYKTIIENNPEVIPNVFSGITLFVFMAFIFADPKNQSDEGEINKPI